MIMWASQVVLVVKNLLANTGDARDSGLIPRSGRFPGEGQGNPLQYSCLENPRDRGTRQAKVHRVTKSWIRLKRFCMPAHTDYVRKSSCFYTTSEVFRSKRELGLLFTLKQFRKILYQENVIKPNVNTWGIWVKRSWNLLCRFL